MFGGAFSEHWIDGQRYGPLPRRHSGKGSAVLERCPSISVFSPLAAGDGFASRALTQLTGDARPISGGFTSYDPAIRVVAFDRFTKLAFDRFTKLD